MPGRPGRAIIPALVPREEVVGASTVLLLAMQTAQIGGPALGGIAISLFGLTAAYAVGAGMFVVVVFASISISVREEIFTGVASGFTAFVDGLRFLRMTPILLAVMSLDFIATFFATSTTLMPIFAERILDMGPDGPGLLLSAPAMGALIGGLIMSVAPIPQRPGLVIIVAILVYGSCITGFGMSSAIWLSLLFLAGSGAADAMSTALRHSIRNLVTPAEFRGRVSAVHTTFSCGGPQLGEVRSGVMASMMGVQAAVALGGLATAIGCLAIARLVPELLRYHTEPEDISPEETVRA